MHITWLHHGFLYSEPPPRPLQQRVTNCTSPDEPRGQGTLVAMGEQAVSASEETCLGSFPRTVSANDLQLCFPEPCPGLIGGKGAGFHHTSSENQSWDEASMKSK